LLVFATSPTLTTPVLGAATATSINKVAITAPATSATLTIADGKTLTVNNTLTFTGTDTSSVAFGTGGTVAYTSNKLSVFAATTSAELAGVISDETGSGALVFATSPSLTTPAIGAATGTSLSLTGGGLTTRPATNQDAMVVSGRAGGTGNFAVTLTPTTLTASRTLTAPDVSGTIVTTGDTGTVTSAMIADGTIVDADVSATAEIAVSKLADGSARQLLQTDAAGTGVEWTSDVSVPGRLIVNGTDITESARDVEESRLIRKFGTMSIGQPGTVPFGVGPVIPPGMSLVGIGPDAYNVIDVYSGSVC
jgi:hypothetical protein